MINPILCHQDIMTKVSVLMLFRAHAERTHEENKYANILELQLRGSLVLCVRMDSQGEKIIWETNVVQGGQERAL